MSRTALAITLLIGGMILAMLVAGAITMWPVFP